MAALTEVFTGANYFLNTTGSQEVRTVFSPAMISYNLNCYCIRISLVDTLPLLRDLRITGAGIQELELSSNSLQILKLHDNSLSKLTLTAKSLREFSIQLGKLLASTYSAYMPNVVKFAAVINYALIPSTYVF